MSRLLNFELFARDPLKNRIPNDGVAKIVKPTRPEEWDVLRYELSNFVCEGEYRRGLETILHTYLENLGRATQPAVWVSGFYGSGKSHLVRVLEFLWSNPKFPDGATARSVAQLPDQVNDMLTELDTTGKRAGGLWSAAGTLGAGAGESVRLAILSIVFAAAGLPMRYAQGRFVLWLLQSGFYDGVRSAVEAEGKDFRRELQNLFVSPFLARALLSVYPDFASGEAEARGLIKAQYPSPEDISDEEMLETVDAVLALQVADSPEIPCSLLVLDELQQYLGDNADRTLRVQNVVEACSSRFQGRLLFVATGQSALQATQQLQKLQGRFTVQVSLSDTDVEEVVRRVVLRKDPAKRGELSRVLEEYSGEIDRQLAETRIRPTDADKAKLAADYPLLPTRRRFWERVLRAIDRAGAAGQLRTQLRIVQEAAEEVALREVGTVVPADFIYGQLSGSMLQTGVLLREVEQTIRDQRDGTKDGDLRYRLCALIFLLGQLPRDAGSDAGLRANPETLADLMVEDIREGSAALRSRIPGLLEDMLDSGKLMLVDKEYRLQTREGSEWTADYQGARARIFGDDARVGGDRSRELREAVGKVLKGVSFTQGESKTPRKIELYFGSEIPNGGSGTIPVWVRDGWSVTEKQARAEAQAAGRESAVVHVFLPRQDAEALKSALAGYEAASEVISNRPIPTTQEGQEARSAMLGRKDSERGRLDAALDAVLRNAAVFLGGGSEITGGSLRAAVEEAGRSALERLYPRFSEADHARWHLVVRRAREGAQDALSAVGYDGDTEKHPVCREVLTFIGPGKKGREVRSRFDSPPYGWPRDAVDGAIFALLTTEHVRASVNGVPTPARILDQSKIGTADLRAEHIVLTIKQRLEVRNLFTEAGVQWRSDEEPQAGRRLLEHMISLAEKAGGASPLPAVPDTSRLRELRDLDGNALILDLYNERDRLRSEMSEWTAMADKAAARRPAWDRLTRLLGNTHDLPEGERLREQRLSVEQDRTLLDEPDPVPPLLSEVTDLLRTSVNEAYQRYAETFDAEMSRLEASEPWQELDGEQRGQILSSAGLHKRLEPRLESGAAILDALNATALSEWESLALSLPERFSRALQEAARRLEPTAVRVKLPSGNLKTEGEVDAYLEDLRGRIMEHVDAGRPVIL